MINYIGVLGDPAKIDLYDDQFFQLLDWDETNSMFHLLGASENDVTKEEYSQMYSKFSSNLQGADYPPIPNLSHGGRDHFSSRIGLFPSSTSHLIKGPSFSFAPFPVNSASTYLKFKSNFLQFILRPFLPFKIKKLAYVPLGGKAARKTQADATVQLDQLPNIFKQLRQKDKFDWYYLEAGSGQNVLPYDTISQVMASQISSITDEQGFSNLEPGSRLIVPNFIYGGGIKSTEQLSEIISPDPEGVKLIPECVIIGNISEDDISITYDLVELTSEMNEILTYNPNNFD